MPTNTKPKWQLTLKNVRLSFPNLFEARSINNGTPRYGANFLIPKDDKEQLRAIKSLLDEVAAEEFEGKKMPSERTPFTDGDDKEYDGYEGCYALSANKTAKLGRPTVVDRNKTPLTAEDDKPYAGCYVNAVVRFYAINGKSDKKSDKSYGKRICCSLEVVQFWKDGEPFGAGKADLDALPDDDGDSFDDL